MQLFYLHGILALFGVAAMLYQTTDIRGPVANAVVVTIFFAEALGVWCYSSVNYASLSMWIASRYYRPSWWSMLGADLISAGAPIFAVWVLVKYDYTAPPFYGVFPAILCTAGQLLHMYAFYLQILPRRSEWVDDMQVPLSDMITDGTAIGEVSTDDEGEEEDIVVSRSMSGKFTIGE